MSAIDEKALAAAKKAFDHAMETPNLIDCQTCAGRGFVHSDWCPRCAGGGVDLADGEENRPLSEAISAYLAALAPQQAAPMLGVDDPDEDGMPELIWAGDFDEQGYGHCVAGMQGGLYSKYVRADLVAALATPEAGTSEPTFVPCDGCDGYECIDRCAYPGVEAGTSEPVAWRVITNNTAMSFYIRREDAEQGAKNRLAYVRDCTSAVVEPLYLAPAQAPVDGEAVRALRELVIRTENFWALIQGEYGVCLSYDEDHNVTGFFLALDDANAVLAAAPSARKEL